MSPFGIQADRFSHDELVASEMNGERIEFSNALYASILEGTKNVLGESGTRVVLFHHQLIRCAKKPTEFHAKLSSIFKEGAVILEKMIAKELFRTLNLPYEEGKPFDFVKFVAIAKESLEN